MMNWKGFERKWTSPHTILAFAKEEMRKTTNALRRWIQAKAYENPTP
jgi:hypothetical protein